MRKILSLIVCFFILFSFASCTPIGGENSGTNNGNVSANLVNMDFYAFNDLHGNLLDSNDRTGGIGVSKTSSFLKSYKSMNENTFVLSTGDMWQGSSEANNTKGKIVTDWMNLNEFDAMTVGNHEFDWGIDAIKENSALADFPILGINVYEKSTNARSEVFQTSVLIEAEDFSVGIIGAIGDCYSSISSSKVTDYYFKTGDELTALVKAESEKLKDNGADFIVYSIHDGYENSINDNTPPTLNASDLDYFYDVSLSDGYVDVVFEAHTHQSYVYKDEYGVYHLQASSNNRAIAHVDADYNKKTGKVTVNKAELTKTDSLILLKDEETEKLFDKYSEEIGAVYEVLGTNYRTRYSEDLEDLTANLYLEAGLKEWGDYPIFLGGGFLRTRSPYNLKSGDVCYKDLQSLFPFDNDIVLCSVSGYYLNKQFVSTSNNDYHCSYSAYGSENKNSIKNDEIYYIVVDSYTSDYAPNHLTVVKRYSKEGVYARDLLADYIKAGGLS